MILIHTSHPDPVQVSRFFQCCATLDSSLREMSPEAWAEFAGHFDPEGIQVVYEENEIIALAYVNAEQSRDRQLRHGCIFVHPNHRRQGIGTALLEKLKQFKPLKVSLETGIHPGWYAGEAFAQHHGFTRWDAEISMKISIPGDFVATAVQLDFSIRSATGNDDIEVLSRIHNSAHALESWRSPQQFQKILLATKTYLLLAECLEKQQVAGMIEFEIESDGSGWINNIAVDPSFQKQGIGRRLIESSLQQLAEQGVSCVALHGYESNPAIRLYERVGFRKTSTTQSYRLSFE